MKKATFGSIILITLSLAACQKTETPLPETITGANHKRVTATQTAVTTFSGRATGLNATVWTSTGLAIVSTQTIWAQTAALPASGGFDDTTHIQGNISGFVSTDSIYAATSGQGSRTVSTSSVTNLRVTAGGNTISAAFVQATANASCGSVRSAGANTTSLIVNGTPITVTGAMNQAIYLPRGGMIILNEQNTSRKGSNSGTTVTGMHIIIPNAADIRLATVQADIKC